MQLFIEFYTLLFWNCIDEIRILECYWKFGNQLLFFWFLCFFWVWLSAMIRKSLIPILSKAIYSFWKKLFCLFFVNATKLRISKWGFIFEVSSTRNIPLMTWGAGCSRCNMHGHVVRFLLSLLHCVVYLIGLN